jgi:hypothetical protein
MLARSRGAAHHAAAFSMYGAARGAQLLAAISRISAITIWAARRCAAGVVKANEEEWAISRSSSCMRSAGGMCSKKCENHFATEESEKLLAYTAKI